MKILGNIIWLIFGGLETAIGYFLSSLALMITIVGIPFGIKTIKIGILCLWPFGSQVVENSSIGGCLDLIMNIIWIFIGGIWICLTHLLFGGLLYITILGIPFGKQHFKLARLALTPFGKDIV